MILWIKILFFGLIPIGIYGFVWVRRLYKKIFKNKVIVELFLDDTEIDFELPFTGYYSVWQKGKFFKRSFVDRYKPQIINLDNNNVVRLYNSMMRPNSNNMNTAEMELFWFKSFAGNYNLSLTDGQSITRMESFLTSPLVFNSRTNSSKSSIQIRKSAFPGASLIFILLMLLSFFCVLGGFVLGLLADQIFTL